MQTTHTHILIYIDINRITNIKKNIFDSNYPSFENYSPAWHSATNGKYFISALPDEYRVGRLIIHHKRKKPAKPAFHL